MKVKSVRMGYLAYVLDEASRATLLKHFPPKFPDVVAHHVTLQHPAPMPDVDPTERVSIKVIGYAEDDSLETLIVEIDGRVQRPDGKVFHCTWSMDKAKGRKAKESNDLIAGGGWKQVTPVTVTGELKFLF